MQNKKIVNDEDELYEKKSCNWNNEIFKNVTKKGNMENRKKKENIILQKLRVK